MADIEDSDIEDILMEHLEACDWDLSEDSIDNIAKKLQNKFSNNYDAALEYVYSWTSAMLDDMKDK